jgi:hypothetical protein
MRNVICISLCVMLFGATYVAQNRVRGIGTTPNAHRTLAMEKENKKDEKRARDYLILMDLHEHKPGDWSMKSESECALDALVDSYLTDQTAEYAAIEASFCYSDF